MNKDFQPLYDEPNKEEFSVWEYKKDEKPVSDPVADEQAILAAECERLREEAKAKGYQEGLQQAQQEINQLREELKQWLEFIQNPVQLVDKQVSEEIIKTIIWLCEACIGIEISNSPEKLLLLLEEIKKELPSLRRDQQLVMNTEDVEWLKSQLSHKYRDIIAILVSDSTLSRGDFYLRNEYSELDGTLKTRVMNLLSAHLGSLTLDIIEDE